MTNILTLPIKKNWFDMIVSGEKKEEYRDLSPYYKSRFKNVFIMYPYSFIPVESDVQEIKLRNGYFLTSPECIIEATLHIKTGEEKWGAEIGKEYYVLKIHKVKNICNL